MDALQDKQTGIALRFIRAFDPTRFEPEHPAMLLAMQDTRPISFMQKLADALTFLQEQGR